MTTVAQPPKRATSKAQRAKRLAAKKRQRPVDLANLPKMLRVSQAAWLINRSYSVIHIAIKTGKLTAQNINEGTDLLPIFQIETNHFLEVYGLTHLAPVKKGGA